MNFEVYCDESHPDVFWSQSNARARFLLIGGLWLASDLRQQVKADINALKQRNGFDLEHEIKWHKVHRGRQDFYTRLIELFVDYGDRLRFRCIAVEGDRVDLVRCHESDSELGFYKFYYEMLNGWIEDSNEYRIFCDEKTNRAGDRLNTLRTVLQNSNSLSRIISVQALPSRQVLLIQLTDFLLGMVSSRMNSSVPRGGFKDTLIRRLEQHLGRGRMAPTAKSEAKFNIFRIHLQDE